MNGRPAVAARRCPLPICRIERGAQLVDIGTQLPDDRRLIAFVDVRVGFQERDPLVELVDGAMHVAPFVAVRTAQPVIGHGRRGAGGEHKRSQDERDPAFGHVWLRSSMIRKSGNRFSEKDHAPPKNFRMIASAPRKRKPSLQISRMWRQSLPLYSPASSSR